MKKIIAYNEEIRRLRKLLRQALVYVILYSQALDADPEDEKLETDIKNELSRKTNKSHQVGNRNTTT